jgi:ABC-type microcin C transport system permease subunit YejB
MATEAKRGIIISEFRGWELLTLRSAAAEVDVVPGKGADILAFRWRATGLNVLWTSPWGLPHRGAAVQYQDSTSAFLDQYPGGWQTIFPNGGYVPLTQNPYQWFIHLILPWTALSVLFIGFYSRVLRGNILETINEDYVRTARAKGLSERRVMVRHVLRNSLIPIVSLWGLDFAAVIGGGAILTESVFNLQGVGQYAADSIHQLDVPPVLVITMLTAFFVVLLSATVDVIYAILDPRIRLSD